jgi:hypothetical protein
VLGDVLAEHVRELIAGQVIKFPQPVDTPSNGDFSRGSWHSRRSPYSKFLIMENGPSPPRSSAARSPRPRVSPAGAPLASTAPAGQTALSLRPARSQVHQTTTTTAPGEPGFSPLVSPVAALPLTDSLPQVSAYALLANRRASDHTSCVTNAMSSDAPWQALPRITGGRPRCARPSPDERHQPRLRPTPDRS